MTPRQSCTHSSPVISCLILSGNFVTLSLLLVLKLVIVFIAALHLRRALPRPSVFVFPFSVHTDKEADVS